MYIDDNFDFDFDAGLETIAPTPKSITVPIDGTSIVIPDSSSAYQHGENLLTLHADLSCLQESMASRLENIKQIDIRIEELRRSVTAQIRELSEEKEKLNVSLFDERRRKKELERQVGIIESLLRQALENERQRKEFIDNAARFDDLTSTYHWREFAFTHQIEGAKHLAAAKRAILGDKMGLGKTLTSLIACDMLQSQKILVVVPDDVVSNFVREVQHWAPHRTVLMFGKQSKIARNMAIDMLKNMAEFTVVVNYSAWRKDSSLLDRFVSLRFDTVILDEAHTIKEVSTNAYKGCARLILAENSCPKCRGAIQQLHTTEDIEINLRESSIYRPSRTYWACIGGATASPVIIKSDRAKAILSLGCGWNEIVDIIANVDREFGEKRSVRNLFTMTGTPILNKPTELYSMLSLIDPVGYPDKNKFAAAYCQQDFQGKWVFKPGGLNRLVTELSGKYIARDAKTAGVVIPKQDIIIHSIEMDAELYPAQAKVMKDLTTQAMIILSSGAKLPILHVIELILRKRQANVWPAGISIKDEDGIVVFSVGDDVTESIKLDRVCTPADRTESGDPEGLIPDFTGNGDFTNGERVVVFSQFKGPLKGLETRLKDAGISVIRFDGDTPQQIRDQIKIDFDRKFCEAPGYEPKWQVVLCNYRTGGVGLNFTAATQTIFLDEEWNPGKADQAMNRTHRIGQTEETTVHILRIENSIDSWMANLIESKRSMIDGFESEIDLQASLLKSMSDGDLS